VFRPNNTCLHVMQIQIANRSSASTGRITHEWMPKVWKILVM
jgi:hypothetical protein